LHILSHTRLILTRLPWKRNRLLFGITFLSLITIWVTIQVSLFSWIYHLCRAISGDILQKLWKCNQNRESRFRENRHFVLLAPSKSSLSSELGCSYVYRRKIDKLLKTKQTINKIRLTVQALAKGTSMKTGRRIPKPFFLYPWVLKSCKFMKSQDFLFFTITILSYIFYICSGQSFWLQIQRSWVRFSALPDFLRSSGSGTKSTQPREDN
jgi:hypothetical protein